MNWFRIWKRRRAREDLSEFKALLATPQTDDIAPDDTATLTLPGPARIGVRFESDCAFGNFRLETGDGDFWDIGADAGVLQKIELVEEGELLTITNNSGGDYTGDIEIGPVDNFGKLRVVWVVTAT